ncbi:MAG: type II toxin-antitoxin system Phd/YefM family antitoxin [Vicinamibacteria bacterium]
MKQINASDFKAKCLAILDEVERTGEPITILKRGRPVAELIPPVPKTKAYAQSELLGSVVIKADVVEPALPAGAWEAEGRDGE